MSRNLAPRFGVTPKTIRDVWSGRTWVEATRHLWTEAEIAARESDKVSKRKDAEDKTEDGADEEVDGDAESAGSEAPALKKPKTAGEMEGRAMEESGARVEPAPGDLPVPRQRRHSLQ